MKPTVLGRPGSKLPQKNMNYSIKNQLRLKQSRKNTLRQERLHKDNAAPDTLSHAFFLDRDLRARFFCNNRMPRAQQTTSVAHSNRNSLKPRQYWSWKVIDSRRSALKTRCQRFKFLNVARKTNFGARSRTQLSMSGRTIGITAVSARSESAPNSARILHNPPISVQLWGTKLSKSCQTFLKPPCERRKNFDNWMSCLHGLPACLCRGRYLCFEPVSRLLCVLLGLWRQHLQAL